MVTHPLETLGGIAKLAGVVVIGGYAAPGGGIMAQQNLQSFDKIFGTDLAAVDAGIKQSLIDAGDTLVHGTNEERGEIVGQAIEFIAEIAVGTKGAGAALKSVKAGSMGSKMAKIAGIVDKAGDILKAAGGKIKQWTLNKLPKAIKGIFGKGAIDSFDYKLYKLKEGEKLGDFGEEVAKKYYQSQGYDEFYRVQNPSGNGVDIVARNSQNGDMVKVEVKTTQQGKLWNGGDTKEIPMSKDQRTMGGEDYTNDRLNRAANGDDGYTDGASTDQAKAVKRAQEQAEIDGADIKTEKLDIYVDKDGNLRGNPVPRKW